MSRLAAVEIERFIGRYSIGRDSNPFNTTGSLHFLRIKVPGGFITSDQLRGVAELAARYARGRAEITDRQDIQLHWIRAEDSLEIFAIMDKMGFTTDMCGQGFAGARYGDPRNIVCCPASGIERDEILDGSSLMRRLTSFFVGNPDFLDMPRKFKFSISGCGSDCTRAEINDLAFVAVKKGDEVGFTLLVGGSVGSSLPGPRLARPTGVFVRPEDAFDVAVATIEIHRDYGNRESKAKARFKWLIENWGVDKFLAMLEEKTGLTLESYDGPVFLRASSHEGIQPQRQEGYYYVNVPLVDGRLTSEEMIRIADLADVYGAGELRLTPTQNIIIPYVKDKEGLLRRLEDLGFSFDVPRLRWVSIGCSSDFCGKTRSPHAKQMLVEIIDHLVSRFGREALDEAGFRIHINGCPNNCCASRIAEIGLIGRLILKDGERIQAYDVFLGGGFGINPSFGRLIEDRVPAGEIKYKIASLFENYLRLREPQEGLREFCNRHTEDELRAFLRVEEG
ncbi:MAG: Sulfite reductase [Candidatus Bathyarchaeota archaeon B63]|nr:MAG: Sulfite reductase [Candidatus Bathyarchaeota archaeon B63]